MNRRGPWGRVVLALIAAFGAGCTGPAGPDVTPTSVSISQGSGVTVTSGSTTTLTATALNASGAAVNSVLIAWSSSDGSVAAVSSSGVVTAGRTGQATITASTGTLSASIAVTVIAGAPDTISISPASIALVLNDTARLTASVKDARGNEVTTATVNWTTSDSKIASISASGLVTGVGLGSTTASASVGGKTATRAITVQPGAPYVKTDRSPGVTSNFIRLVGYFDSRGAPGYFWFLYGTSPTLAGASESGHYGPSDPTGFFGLGLDFPNLQPSTTYYYRLIGENSVGRTTGEIVGVTTSPATGTTLYTQSGISGGASSPVTAQFTVPANTSRLEVTTTSTSGRPGFVLRFNSPTASDDCSFNWTYTSFQVCSVESPKAGTWYAVISSDNAFSGTTLKAVGYSSGSTQQFTLTTSTSGTGSGTITASPIGPSYNAGTSVTLTATANTGSSFTSWGGDCSGTSSTCTVTMNANKTVTATFTASGGGGVAAYNGEYVGRYTGTFTGLGSISDIVVLNVSNGTVTATAPSGVGGTVSALGVGTLQGTVSGASCQFPGTFAPKDSNMVITGTWTCSGGGTGSGTWTASRYANVNFVPGGVWIYASSGTGATIIDTKIYTDSGALASSYCDPKQLVLSRSGTKVRASVLCASGLVTYSCAGQGSQSQPQLQLCDIDPLKTPLARLLRVALPFTGSGVVTDLFDGSAILDAKIVYCKTGAILVGPPTTTRLYCL